MAKFSKGDKVESVKTGAKGVVDEVYGDEKYAVLFDGATNPDRVEGFQIKAANAKACNAAPLTSANAVVQNAINARRARNASTYVMVKAWEDFVEDAGRFIRSSSLSRLVGLAAKTPEDAEGKKVRDVIDAATSEISAVTDKIQNIIRKYGSRI